MDERGTLSLPWDDGGAPAGDDYAHQFSPPFRLDPARAALVVVDMQYASAARDHGLGRFLAARGQEARGKYRFDRIESVVVPTIQRLLEGFRRRGSFPTSAPRAGRSTRSSTRCPRGPASP